MTIVCGEQTAQSYFDDGWIEVERKRRYDKTTDKSYILLTLAHPDKTCLRKMRTGLCTMDKGHRGRCSTITFGCDGCGKTRRGTPHVSNEEIALCFMCSGKPFREQWEV